MLQIVKETTYTLEYKVGFNDIFANFMFVKMSNVVR